MNQNIEWVREARAGDSEAFSKLYETIYKELYKFALYTLKNTYDAEDIVSETVIAAWQEIPRLRKEEAFHGWIFRILTNKCKRRLKQSGEKTVQIQEDLLCEEWDVCQEMDVRKAFFQLSDEERLILSMNLFGGYSSKEIGKELKMKDNTVRTKQRRALKKMEICLRE